MYNLTLGQVARKAQAQPSERKITDARIAELQAMVGDIEAQCEQIKPQARQAYQIIADETAQAETDGFIVGTWQHDAMLELIQRLGKALTGVADAAW